MVEVLDRVSQSARGSQCVTVSGMGSRVSREQGGRVLSGMEVSLVRYLEGHAGRFVAEWELRDFLYQGQCGDSAVRQLVVRVRGKLGASFIERGELGGYRLASLRAADLARVCVRCGRPVVVYEGEVVCYGCPGTGHVELEVGRAAYREGSRSGKAWTEEERAFAVGHNGDMSFEEIGAALDRSEASVRGEYQKLGLKKRYVRAAREGMRDEA